MSDEKSTTIDNKEVQKIDVISSCDYGDQHITVRQKNLADELVKKNRKCSLADYAVQTIAVINVGVYAVVIFVTFPNVFFIVAGCIAAIFHASVIVKQRLIQKMTC